ncbi:MAG TPA: YifB family Mg chelatase-like AAA ATPase [Syntrophobacteraceae bacterium]|nr:YifB family Mg chelatase-like AAA ATPase [Syntrophobacteraceae bacterium]
MIAKVHTCSLLGIDAILVEVEVDLSPGLPGFSTVGLPDNIVRESKDRVKTALHNSGYPFPSERITVNLAPAHLKKEGAGFDLPIALGILAAMGMVHPQRAREVAVVGELSLDGRVKPVAGSLPIAIQARRSGYAELLLPRSNACEAAVAEGLSVLPVGHLSDAVEFLNGRASIEPARFDAQGIWNTDPAWEMDFDEVKGQEHAKRALEVAAAGGHNALMLGPPGAGKTMLARRIPGILPLLSFEEALETSKIFSVAGQLHEPLMVVRPFRAPHHTISDAGLVGGGHIPRPGEVSLAHNGVLFLDEFPEFRRNVLDLLRQPLEEGSVTIARAAMSLTYPSRFMLIAAMNPCPCGYAGDPVRTCLCSPHQVLRYRGRISGPILDRIDLHIEVPALKYEELHSTEPAEPSARIRERVIACRERQLERFAGQGIYCNALMKPKAIKSHCRLDSTGQSLLEEAIRRLGLSARAYHRILKVARTIADLEARESIAPHHLLEAIQYRSLDRALF